MNVPHIILLVNTDEVVANWRIQIKGIENLTNEGEQREYPFFYYY